MVIIVFGLPGSGKSYFAEALASSMDAAYLSSDRIRKELFQVRAYTDEEKTLVYSEMMKRMTIALSSARSAVLDATFYRHSLRNLFFQKACSLNEPLKYIEVCADETIIKRRLQMPRKDSEADFFVYLKLKDMFEPLKEPHLILDSSLELKEMLLKAKDYLGK